MIGFCCALVDACINGNIEALILLQGEILLAGWLRDNFLDLLLLYGSFQCKVLLLLDRI